MTRFRSSIVHKDQSVRSQAVKAALTPPTAEPAERQLENIETTANHGRINVSHQEFNISTQTASGIAVLIPGTSCVCPVDSYSFLHFFLRYVNALILGIAERAVTCSATHGAMPRTVFSLALTCTLAVSFAAPNAEAIVLPSVVP